MTTSIKFFIRCRTAGPSVTRSTDGKIKKNTGKISFTLTLRADGSFTYTPGPTFQGIDRFTYQVTEAGVAGNIATVTLLKVGRD